MDNPKAQQSFPVSEKDPLVELAFYNICYHIFLEKIQKNAPTGKVITKENYENFEKIFDDIMEEYENQICEENEKLMLIKKYLNKNNLNSLTEEVCTNYLTKNLYNYIDQIYKSNQNIFLYIMPLLLYTNKKSYNLYNSMLRRLKDEKNDLVNQINNLEKKLEKQINEIKNKEIKELKQKNNGLNKEINGLNKEIKELKRKNNTMEEELLKKNEEIKELQIKNDGQEKEFVKNNKDIIELKLNNSSLEERLLKNNKDINELKIRNKDLEEELLKNNKDIKELKSKIHERNCEIDIMNKENKKAHENLEAEISKNNNNSKIIKIYEELEKNNKNKIKELESRIDSLEKDLDIAEGFVTKQMIIWKLKKKIIIIT